MAGAEARTSNFLELLRPSTNPIQGREQAADYLSNVDDSRFTLSWEPLGGDIANSGELGYTYGTYKLQIDTVILVGTYTSIWKKDAAGKWKFVLDTGNDGLGD